MTDDPAIENNLYRKLYVKLMYIRKLKNDKLLGSKRAKEVRDSLKMFDKSGSKFKLVLDIQYLFSSTSNFTKHVQ